MASLTKSLRTGSCMCGNVKLEVEGEPEWKLICHCTECQKSSGVVFRSNVMYPKENVKITKSTDDALTEYASTTNEAGNTKVAHFCKTCGSMVLGTSPGLAHLVCVPMGILDKEPDKVEDIKPAWELFCSQRMSWLPAVPGAQEFDKMPH